MRAPNVGWKAIGRYGVTVLRCYGVTVFDHVPGYRHSGSNHKEHEVHEVSQSGRSR
jgi:hypothetical protein